MDDIINYELKYPVKRLSINILEEETVTERVYLSKLEDLAGKSVKSAKKDSNLLCLELTDGSILALEYVGDEADFLVLRRPGEFFEYLFGLITEARFNEWQNREKKARREYVEERERLEYERLKAKFEE